MLSLSIFKFWASFKKDINDTSQSQLKYLVLECSYIKIARAMARSSSPG